MARTNKVGIDYFSFDVDFFNDDKIQLIEAEFGTNGSIIAIRLLCKIYNEGYYYGWGEDQCLLFAKNAGSEFNAQIVQDIVDGLIRRSFFDANCYEKYNILTSAGIQRRYLDATVRYKEVKMIKEYLLIEEPNRDNVIINAINVDINSFNGDTCTQRKGKEKEIEIESKGEETNDNNKKEKNKSPLNPPVGETTKKNSSDKLNHYVGLVPEEWKESVETWLSYKRSRGQLYKNEKSFQSFFNTIQKESGGIVSIFQKSIEQSIKNNWAGVFPQKQLDKKHPMVDHNKEKIYEKF